MTTHPPANLDKMNEYSSEGGMDEEQEEEMEKHTRSLLAGSPQTRRPSELVLEGLRGEGLDDGLGRLRLHHYQFSENLALPGLGRLLLAGLDGHNTRNDEFPVLLGLCRCNACESAQGRADHAPLHLAALRERCGEGALGHDRGFHHRRHLCCLGDEAAERSRCLLIRARPC